jgi:hypothetical protein
METNESDSKMAKIEIENGWVVLLGRWGEVQNGILKNNLVYTIA